MTTTKPLPKVKEFIDQSFEAKLLHSQSIIAKWIRFASPEQLAVAFSGGKDSTVVLKLVLDYAKLFSDPARISVVFTNTGIEYPETRKFVHAPQSKWGFNLIELKPTKSFWECVNIMGHYPRGKSNRDNGHADICCYTLKEAPMRKAIKKYNLKLVFTGVTALESHQRMIRASTHGTCYFAIKEKIQKVHPILYWSEQDVWDYIKLTKTPYNPIYDLGCDRCGCMTCTAYKLWKINLGKTHPKMLTKIESDMLNKGME